ncbi:contactin-2 isoform X2 [Procambarus clarkii]|uniref:contactin-2 isoform X2 n=1 Tax=Procambarus clarkii TaxID=6728 RepID=UPI003743A01F
MTVKDILMLLYILPGLCEAFQQDDTIFVDIHDNVTLPCRHDTHNNTENGTYWFRPGKHWPNEEVLPDGSIFVANVTKNAYFKCMLSETSEIISSIRLVVRGPPDPPENVVIKPSAVTAIVTWHLHLKEEWEGFLEGPKTTFHLRYRPLLNSQWLVLPHHIAPSQGLLEVYKLKPNTTYEFQLWTSNSYGESEIVKVVTTTHPFVSDIELAKMLEETLEEFSPSVWIVAVVVVLVVATVLASFLLVIYYFKKSDTDDHERIELIPHIFENPGYQVEHSQSLETIHESILSPSTSAKSAAATV